jgi:hypothetical protein
MTNAQKIPRLVALWYETISGLHHKDRDCHFRINSHWRYSGEHQFEVEHAGYLLDDICRTYPTLELAEASLVTMLKLGIDSWIDCEDSALTNERRKAIQAEADSL